MTESIKVCQTDTKTEFVEKKSRFITTLVRVDNEDDAKAVIDRVKSEYKDASHNCYAYRLYNPRVERFSDAGEPNGTAGMPMLEVLKKEDVYDVCVVVTRYFGGILLGGGGLIRAYGKGVSDALKSSGYAYRHPSVTLSFCFDYSGHSKVMKILENTVHNEHFCEFGADVKLEVSVKKPDADALVSAVRDALCGNVKVQIVSEGFDSFKNK